MSNDWTQVHYNANDKKFTVNKKDLHNYCHSVPA